MNKTLYYDRICKIIETDFDRFVAYYNWSQSPKPKDKLWIELQIKIIARKKWSRAWSMKYDNNSYFPKWTVIVKRNKIVNKRDKKYQVYNKTKEVF